MKLTPTSGLTWKERVVASFYCLKDPQTRTRAKVALFASIFYFFIPLDLIPDFIPGLGQLDDLGVIMAAMVYLQRHIGPKHVTSARKYLGKIN